jgi:CRP/FNR family transcriptional regulator, anaerobic regulatory protein
MTATGGIKSSEGPAMFSVNSISHHRSPAPRPMAPVVPSLASIFSDRPTERFQPGSTLFCEGDDASHVFELVEGVLRIFKIIGDGRRAITGFLYPGDIVGVSMRDIYLYSAEAINPVKIRRFARSSFQEAINLSAELRPQLFAKLCDEMAAAQDQMVLLSRKNAEERICTFLISLARRLSGNQGVSSEIEIPMVRLDIADYLGLTIETVSRTISNLTNRGIIGQTNRHEITIKKLETLLRLSGNGDNDDIQAPARPALRQAVWPN